MVRVKELRAKDHLQPGEAAECHSLHRLFVCASELGSRIWDFTASRTLAEHLQVSGHIIDSVCGPSASDTVTRTRHPTAPNHPPPSRSRSPRPSSTSSVIHRPSSASSVTHRGGQLGEQHLPKQRALGKRQRICFRFWALKVAIPNRLP